MFSELIMECRAVIYESKKKRRKKSFDERPEVVVVPGPTLPKRGYDGTAPYSHANASRSTIGSGSHGQSSHT